MYDGVSGAWLGAVVLLLERRAEGGVLPNDEAQHVIEGGGAKLAPHRILRRGAHRGPRALPPTRRGQGALVEGGRPAWGRAGPPSPPLRAPRSVPKALVNVLIRLYSVISGYAAENGY